MMFRALFMTISSILSIGGAFIQQQMDDRIPLARSIEFTNDNVFHQYPRRVEGCFLNITTANQCKPRNGGPFVFFSLPFGSHFPRPNCLAWVQKHDIWYSIGFEPQEEKEEEEKKEKHHIDHIHWYESRQLCSRNFSNPSQLWRRVISECDTNQRRITTSVRKRYQQCIEHHLAAISWEKLRPRFQSVLAKFGSVTQGDVLRIESQYGFNRSKCWEESRSESFHWLERASMISLLFCLSAFEGAFSPFLWTTSTTENQQQKWTIMVFIHRLFHTYLAHICGAFIVLVCVILGQ